MSSLYDEKAENLTASGRHCGYCFSMPTKVAAASMYALLLFVGTVANFTIVFYVFKCKRLRKATNIFIANLSVGDLVMNVPLVFTPLQAIQGQWYWGAHLCKIFGAASNLGVYVSALTLCTLSVYRQLVILKKIDHRSGKSKAIVVCLVIWTASAIASSPAATAVGLHHERNSTDKVLCVEAWENSTLRRLYNAAVFVTQFCIPSCVMLYSHLRIRFFLVKQFEISQLRLSTTHQLRKIKRQQRLQRILFIMILIFIINWLPVNAFALSLEFFKFSISPKSVMIIYLFVNFFAMASTVLNPLVYALWNSEIQSSIICTKANHRNRRR